MSRYIWRKKTEMMKAQWQMRQTASLDFSIIEKLWNPGATKRQSTPFQDSSICLQNWTVRLNLTTSTWPFSVKTLSHYLSLKFRDFLENGTHENSPSTSHFRFSVDHDDDETRVDFEINLEPWLRFRYINTRPRIN